MTRWRAERGKLYFYINDILSVEWDPDYRELDNHRYKSGNYFETEAEAKEVAEKLRAILKEHHEEKEGGEK